MSDPYLSWHDPDVARQMRALVETELGPGYEEHPPYKYFFKAMDFLLLPGWIADDAKLCDAGCGVGHYSILTCRRYPQLKYTGFDFSPPMIEEAKKLCPKGEFFVADVKEMDYSGYDVVLVSSVIEPLDNYREGLDALCKTANIIVLHRVRYGTDTERLEAGGYSGQRTWRWIHNEQELTNFFRSNNFLPIWLRRWDVSYPMATHIFRRIDDY